MALKGRDPVRSKIVINNNINNNNNNYYYYYIGHTNTLNYLRCSISHQHTCDTCLKCSIARTETGVISQCFPCFVFSTKKACSTKRLMTWGQIFPVFCSSLLYLERENINMYNYINSQHVISQLAWGKCRLYRTKEPPRIFFFQNVGGEGIVRDK